MILFLAIACYAGAMILANLLVVQFGPVVTPINSFVLIGLDLVLRDWLHVKVRPWQMGALIAFAGLLSWLLNPAAQFIAIASAVSFAVAALVDWIVFVNVKGGWFKRSIKSNVAGAAVDSMLFPAIAFGAFMPLVSVSQFAAKVAGGALWAYLFTKTMTPAPLDCEGGCMTDRHLTAPKQECTAAPVSGDPS